MKKLLLACASVCATLVLPGCLQNETTIHLNKDGSGTLVEETRLGPQMLAMFDQMAALGGPDAAKEDPVAKMFSEDKAKARATELGDGVTYDKTEAINANGSKGARVTYHFKDINTLKITPGDSMKNMSPMAEAKADALKNNATIAFSYTGGNLTIRMPEPPKADGPAAPIGDNPNMPDMDNPDSEAMVKQMLGDMKLSLKLVAEPGIAESNATYKTANTVTLMEMDMGKILEKPSALKKFGKLDKNNPAAAMQAFKGLDGAKLETQKEVTVKIK